VSIRSSAVNDINGDHDGMPDTNETVELMLTVRSPSLLEDLTGVVVMVSTRDPKIDCITPTVATIPSLPAGSEVQLSFELHVHPAADRSGPTVTCGNPGPLGTCSNFVEVAGGCDVDADCRRTASEDYSAALEVEVHSDQHPALTPGHPHEIVLDLDLNISQPALQTTTFMEGFESGFGTFTLQNLDDNKATNASSDGYRCQYDDPDYPNSMTYGETECFLGFAAGQAPVNDWHLHGATSPDGGRAYLGRRSLHYGKHVSPDPALDTYGLSQLDAIRSKVPINLAAMVCRDDPAPNKRSCSTASDCLATGGGPCVSASPVLSLKQQVSLVDSRLVPAEMASTVDRAVVQAQIAPGAWQKLYPFENVYTSPAEIPDSWCTFDPIDDGNDEDSYFDPADPRRRFGPSSTCFPEFAFSWQGDTGSPFDALNIGGGSDGPGLAGSLGLGTWLESRFDLSRFRGRSIRMRFLLTSMKIDLHETWGIVYSYQGTSDDGWYIDDVRVSQTVAGASSTITLDAADNSALPGNMDGDARGDECDCAPSDPSAFAISDVTGLRFDPDRVTLRWDSAIPTSGPETVHDVVRGVLAELPVGEGPGEVCLASGTTSATATDPVNPPLGSGFWYLVRSRNSCGGTYGFRSNGAERVTAACP